MGQDEQQKLERLQIPEIGEVLDDRYSVQGVLATGGMGVILRAEQLPMERPVALKLLHPHIAASDPHIVERFEREVRLAKQLNHPNTIRLYDFGESKNGLVYVAMELLDGMDLKRHIARGGGMSAGRALEITRQMLDGLAEAHARGFIHRDLKPSNVFIVKNRRGEDLVKLLDFGIAKSLSDSADLTGSGSICGTPSYVAPEYLMQERPGKPADIYAVGLILLEMLTGRQVFKGEAPVQTMMMHLKLDPDIPDEIAQTPLKEVIERATAKDPAERYGDAEEMYAAVREVMSKVPADLVVRRPNLEVLPETTEAVESEMNTDERERAEVHTVVAKAPDADQDSSLDLPQAQSTPSWVERAVSSDIFRRELRRQLEAEACQDDEVHGAARPAEAAVERGEARGDDQVVPWAWVGRALALVALVGIGVFWGLDPGPPPELGASSESLSRQGHAGNAEAAGGRSGRPGPQSAHTGAKPASNVEPHEELDMAARDDSDTDPQAVRFDLDTDPSGARVLVGEQEVGRTPMTHGVAPQNLPQVMRFEIEGYQPREVELTHTSSPIVVEILEEQERQAVRQKSPRAAAQPRSGSGDREGDEPLDEANASRKQLSDERIEQVMDEYLFE